MSGSRERAEQIVGAVYLGEPDDDRQRDLISVIAVELAAAEARGYDRGNDRGYRDGWTRSRAEAAAKIKGLAAEIGSKSENVVLSRQHAFDRLRAVAAELSAPGSQSGGHRPFDPTEDGGW